MYTLNYIQIIYVFFILQQTDDSNFDDPDSERILTFDLSKIIKQINLLCYVTWYYSCLNAIYYTIGVTICGQITFLAEICALQVFSPPLVYGHRL